MKSSRARVAKTPSSRTTKKVTRSKSSSSVAVGAMASHVSSTRRSSSSSTTTTTATRQRPITVVLGPPGGGKGTISKRLVTTFKFHHISTGDLLRAEVKEQTELGKLAEQCMKRGDLVPDDVVIGMVNNAVEAHPNVPILLDGFPRNTNQAIVLGKSPSTRPTNVINLAVPDSEIVQRISSRWTHLPSGRVYAYDFNPPKVHGKDDVTGEDLIQRSDDTAESVKQRLNLYHTQTAPLIKFYDEQKILKSYDGSNNPELLAKGRRSDAIYEDLVPDMKAFFESYDKNDV